jgi:ABC-2 type transport system ATP-binding protein
MPPTLSSSSRTLPPSQATAPVVAVQSLTKIFKDFWLRQRARAVDNVSFHIDQGEIFGLLGPNGSGKSTTIKVILGLLQPTRGRVAVFGRPPTDVSIKKRIGYLPEESYLYPFLNARETLDYYGKLFQLDHRTRQRRIDELLDMVGLAGVQFRQVREYSKGMQRRIGIAQALINDPDFLILDEPTTGLDPIGTRQIKDLIIELGRRGKSILLSSHLLGDVEDCVNRMVILYGGQIQREGTCDSLLTASSGTVIQTEDLDDATISQIDRLIRERTHGEKSIGRVSRPRQRLEDLFISLVEEAQRRKLATSGAQHGGMTAAFLRADAAEQGEALINKLVAGESEQVRTAPAAAPAPTPEVGPDEGMIGGLLDEPTSEHAAAPVQPPKARSTGKPASPSAPSAPQQTDVDLGVIGNLLDDQKGSEGKSPDGKGRA